MTTMYTVKLVGGPYDGRFWTASPFHLMPKLQIINDRMLTKDMVRARWSENLLPPEPIVLEYKPTGRFDNDHKPIFEYVQP